jgi:hypothetical protein
MPIRRRPPNGWPRLNRLSVLRERTAPSSFCQLLTARPRSSGSERISLPICLTAIPSRSNGNLLFQAISRWRNGSRPSSAGTRSPWSCARRRPMAISVVTSRATPPPPRFLRLASIISSTPTQALTTATLSSSNRIRRQASMRALFSKAGCRKSSSSGIARRSTVAA